MILTGVILTGVFALNLFVFLETPSGQPGGPDVEMVIDHGTPVKKIVQDLQAQGIITNIPLFKIYIFFKRASSKIRAGEYHFQSHRKPAQVLTLLMKGDFAIHSITLVEGWTVREIASYLQDLKLIDASLFIARCSDPVFISSLGLSVPSLEGYLYPDTYRVYKPKSEEEMIRKFVDHFKGVYAKDFEMRTRELATSQQDVVNLASIIEKETGNKDERPLIASVFLNRLKRGMPLASDPTIIYGIRDFSGNLTRRDLTTPGPYNTYLNAGLPPTPISNPGSASIRAVLYPAETDYLFFVSKNDGTHYFSKNEAEHAAAVRRYQVLLFRHSETRSALPPKTP